MKKMSRILPKFAMPVTSDQFSAKLNSGWKKNQNGRFIAICRILRQ